MKALISEEYSKCVIKKIKKMFVLMCMMCVMFLTGCQVDTSTDLYNHIKQQTDVYTNNTAQIKKDSVVYLTEKAYDFCNNLKRVAPMVIIGSEVIGLALLNIVKEDQRIRKHALFLFIITIPLIMFLLTYGLSWLVGTFL